MQLGEPIYNNNFIVLIIFKFEFCLEVLRMLINIFIIINIMHIVSITIAWHTIWTYYKFFIRTSTYKLLQINATFPIGFSTGATTKVALSEEISVGWLLLFCTLTVLILLFVNSITLLFHCYKAASVIPYFSSMLKWTLQYPLWCFPLPGQNPFPVVVSTLGFSKKFS